MRLKFTSFRWMVRTLYLIQILLGTHFLYLYCCSDSLANPRSNSSRTISVFFLHLFGCQVLLHSIICSNQIEVPHRCLCMSYFMNELSDIFISWVIDAKSSHNSEFWVSTAVPPPFRVAAAFDGAPCPRSMEWWYWEYGRGWVDRIVNVDESLVDECITHPELGQVQRG